jgi:hypothetical protein
MEKPTEFQIELSQLLNKYSKENGSDTPDTILASFLIGCLQTFDFAVSQRERWYGRQEWETIVSDLDEPNNIEEK